MLRSGFYNNAYFFETFSKNINRFKLIYNKEVILVKIKLRNDETTEGMEK